MRSFALPANVDVSHVKAGFRDGMLNLTLPKTAHALASEVKTQ